MFRVALDQGLYQCCLANLELPLAIHRKDEKIDVPQEVPLQQQLWGAPPLVDGRPREHAIAFL